VSRTPDDALAELRELRDRIDALEPESPEYHTLETRRNELAIAAQEAADAARSPENLRAELEHLERRLAQYEAEKINVPAWQQAMATINDPSAHAYKLNSELDAKNQSDREAVEQRIARLKKALSR
jgi:chromosome segregation ATPase